MSNDIAFAYRCQVTYKLVRSFYALETRMKVTRARARENRDRIVDAARVLFATRGFSGAGVAEIMNAAGLTHGGFYRQFESKDALIREASAKGFEATRNAWSEIIRQNADEPFDALVHFYVSPNDPHACGTRCMLAALSSDVARLGPSTQEAFATGLSGYLEVIDTIIPSASEAERRNRSIAAVAHMVGAIVLARAVRNADNNLASEILCVVSSTLASTRERDRGREAENRCECDKL
jgi:TetR/AcrR family transcriptional regulator, transcriptional repressor for nem operon